ncbi:MAG: HDOD domain-containing protein [Betaproteobacteria bacterium]|nr:HDOD domain-containing protein [Betaproteobacteria bacterium]
MPVATSALEAEKQLAAPETDALVKNIGIPPRPSVLVALQQEMATDDPNLRRIAALVASDVAMTVALLKVVNSPYSLCHANVNRSISPSTCLGLSRSAASSLG